MGVDGGDRSTRNSLPPRPQLKFPFGEFPFHPGGYRRESRVGMISGTMTVFFTIFESVMSHDSNASGMTERTEADKADEGREHSGETIRAAAVVEGKY